MLASLKQELGDLDRVKAWIKVLGFVKCAEGFNVTPAVINGFSDLILALWGEPAAMPGRRSAPMSCHWACRSKLKRSSRWPDQARRLPRFGRPATAETQAGAAQVAAPGVPSESAGHKGRAVRARRHPDAVIDHDDRQHLVLDLWPVELVVRSGGPPHKCWEGRRQRFSRRHGSGERGRVSIISTARPAPNYGCAAPRSGSR